MAFSRWLRVGLAFVFAGSTLLYTVLWTVAAYRAPGAPVVELGYDADYLPREHAQLIRNVQTNSPAEAAGMRAGDRIVAIEGQPLLDEYYQPRMWRTHSPGDTVHLTLLRPGIKDPLLISGVFRLRSSASREIPLVEQVGNQFRNMIAIPFVSIGLIVLFLRIDDRKAWLLAVLFAALAVATGGQENIPALFPPARGFAMAYRAVFAGLLPGLFYWFCTVFPARSPLDRRAPWLKWLSVAIGLWSAYFGRYNGNPAAPAVLDALLGKSASNRILLFHTYFWLALGLAAITWNYIRPPDAGTRRRIRVLFWGVAVGIGPVAAIQALRDIGRLTPPQPVMTLEILLLFLFPLSFAYAVVKDQVMEVPVLLRRSARYLLVQRGFTFLLLMASTGFTLLFAFEAWRMYPGTANTLPYATVVGAMFGTGLFWTGSEVHRRVSGTIDRAFFRKSYDARVLLEELAEQSAAATDRADLARLLERHLREGLHPVSVLIYLRDADGSLALFAGSPPEAAGAVPVKLESGGARDFPGAEAIMPIPARRDGLAGLLVLGPRLSEEPYSGEARRLIATVARHAGMAVENFRMAEEIAHRIERELRTAREMEIARDVQRRLLPQAVPSLSTLDCAAECIQARSVGGDYFDFLHAGPDKIAIALADVSGKGVHAALLMANLQAHLRGQSGAPDFEPAAVLRRVNRLLWESTSAQHYATLFLGVYDDARRRLRYVNCGHNPPLILSGGNEVRRLEATATVLGLFERWECEPAEVDLRPGDLLAVFSDGVSEAARGEEEFGEARLIEELRRRRECTPREVVGAVLQKVLDFSEGEQGDDLTLVVARAKPQDLPGVEHPRSTL